MPSEAADHDAPGQAKLAERAANTSEDALAREKEHADDETSGSGSGNGSRNPHTPPPDGYYTSHATSSQDGTSVMDDASLFNYHARNMLLWSHWVMGFLPERLKVEIDAERFLSAFSYTSQSGETEATCPWKMAPFPSVISPYGDKHVDTQTSMLHTHSNRMSKALPRAADTPVDLDYLTCRGKRTRPSCKSFLYLNESRPK